MSHRQPLRQHAQLRERGHALAVWHLRSSVNSSVPRIEYDGYGPVLAPKPAHRGPPVSHIDVLRARHDDGLEGDILHRSVTAACRSAHRRRDRPRKQVGHPGRGAQPCGPAAEARRSPPCPPPPSEPLPSRPRGHVPPRVARRDVLELVAAAAPAVIAVRSVHGVNEYASGWLCRGHVRQATPTQRRRGNAGSGPHGTAATRPPLPGWMTNNCGADLSEASPATMNAGAWDPGPRRGGQAGGRRSRAQPGARAPCRPGRPDGPGSAALSVRRRAGAPGEGHDARELVAGTTNRERSACGRRREREVTACLAPCCSRC